MTTHIHDIPTWLLIGFTAVRVAVYAGAVIASLLDKPLTQEEKDRLIYRS
jgi:hypothetical protein